MSQLQVNRINDASGGVLAPISSVMRNRIINGAMVIDQRNAGASVSVSTTEVYTVDRWAARLASGSGHTVQRSTTAPAGFKNSLLATIGTGASPAAGDRNNFVQKIEGFNVADLDFGNANAKTITISFWVRSSVTGTFSGAVANSATNRSYPFTFVINSANTFEQKSVTITGDTTGTWLTDNGNGMFLWIDLGAGANYQGTAGAWAAADYRAASGATKLVATSGATFYITGVQLEVGTQATSFEYRQYQQELALAQRYCNRLDYANGASVNTGYVDSATSARGGIIFPTMRTSASASASSATHFKLDNGAGAYVGTGISFDGLTPTSARLILNSSGMTSGQGGIFLSVNASAYILLTAEL
jgi:hypothetical protein